jgi:hypothetical protein
MKALTVLLFLLLSLAFLLGINKLIEYYFYYPTFGLIIHGTIIAMTTVAIYIHKEIEKLKLGSAQKITIQKSKSI